MNLIWPPENRSDNGKRSLMPFVHSSSFHFCKLSFCGAHVGNPTLASALSQIRTQLNTKSVWRVMDRP